MIIENASIQLSSQRSFTSERQRSESLTIENAARRFPGRGNGLGDRENLPENARDFGDSIEIALPDLSLIGDSPALQESAARLTGDDELNMDAETKLFKMLIEEVLGQKVNITKVDPITGGSGGPPGQGGAAPPGFNRGGDVAITYDYSESYYEAESTSFSAQGVVQTKDGREIRFNLDLEMNREYYEETNLSLRIGGQPEPVDPLVINLDNAPAKLTDAKYEFDLDEDGENEEVSFLRSGSAFLAFDRNQDGVINDGGELFGPRTGNGFAELAVYDEDGNAFIDSGDSIYQSLSLFNKTEAGDQLTSLEDAGVGAIYLGSASTEFSLNTLENEQLGQVRQSGVYLSEDGEVGSVQQIDLSV